IIMKSQSPGRSSRRPRRNGSRRRFDTRADRAESKAPAKKSIWQKITGFFGSAEPAAAKRVAPAPRRDGVAQSRNGSPRPRVSRKLAAVDVTAPRLYVGN